MKTALYIHESASCERGGKLIRYDAAFRQENFLERGKRRNYGRGFRTVGLEIKNPKDQSGGW